MTDTEALITRYRPTKWSEVVGHEDVVASLRDAVANQTSHNFLFGGRTGSGKTTLAGLVARSLGAEGSDIVEVPASIYTGIDDMRPLITSLNYVPLTGEKKVVILDEVQGLSKKAFESLLIPIEKPPAHVYWILCTTEPAKVPATIRRRCLSFDLKEVSKNAIAEYLSEIAEAEGVPVVDGFGGVIDICAREARGSPGQALANLAVCLQAKDRSDAVSLLRAAEEASEAGELIKLLLERAPWERMQPVLYKLRETDAESIRYAVRGSLTKILVETKSPDKAAGLASILQPFSTPFYGFADVVIAVCRIVFEES